MIIKPGDEVICVRRVQFMDNTSHEVGQIINVNHEDAAYFNVIWNNGDYRLLRKPDMVISAVSSIG